MNEYLIKKSDGQIRGPYPIDKVALLYRKSEIIGTEEFLLYPEGSWRPLSYYPELEELIEAEKQFPQQFSYKQSDKLSQFKEKKLEEKSEVDEILSEGEERLEDEAESLEKTTVKRFIVEDIDKTTVRPHPFPLVKKEEQEDLEEEVPEDEEKTQVFNTKDLADELKPQAVQTEKSWKKKFDFIQKKQKGLRPLFVILFGLIALYVIFDSEEEQKDKVKVVWPEITIPQPFEVADEAKSSQLYREGLKVYGKKTFASKILAAQAFKASLENKFQENKALGKLILAYAELLPHVKNKLESGKTLFKLIEIAKTRSLSDIYVVMGDALFFLEFDKAESALKVIENYLRLGKPSLRLFSFYLRAALKAGDLVKAKTIYEKLEESSYKSSEIFLGVVNYLMVNDNYEEAFRKSQEGLKISPKSVPLLLQQAQLFLYRENFKSLKNNLIKIGALEAERSALYYSQYLEYYGVLAAANKKPTLAAAFFKQALEYHESPDLRSKLGILEVPNQGKNIDFISPLILESKVMDLLRKAKFSLQKKRWNEAFLYALEASDLAPNFLPAKVILARIQIQQGYYGEAIKLMRDAQKKGALDPFIHYTLAEAYSESYKFNEATRELNFLAGTDHRASANYAFHWGKLYLKSDNYLQSVIWLRRTIKRNPLNDEAHYLLGKTFIKNRAYDKAKPHLNKAITLNPGKVEYKVEYAKIIYEYEESPRAAIGYLRDILRDHPDDPLVLGEIAIYYRRNGQTKYYEETKKELESLPNKNTSFYSFLIKSSQMESEPQKTIQYARELIKLEPGRLDIRLLLAEKLYEMKRFTEALGELQEIQKRLPSYPRVFYYLSLVHVALGDNPKALEDSLKEIEFNPRSEYGYTQAGNIYTRKNDYSEAKRMFEKAQKINGNSVPALLGLAWIKYKQNHVESALRLYQKAAELDPGNAPIYRQLGYVYKAMGQNQSAVLAFETYLSIANNTSGRDPNDAGKIRAYIQSVK